MTDIKMHLVVWHEGLDIGFCAEKGDACSHRGFVWTVEGPRLADDPTRNWTEAEIDAGKPWKVER